MSKPELTADRYESRSAAITAIKAELRLGGFHRRVTRCKLVGSVLWVIEEITLGRDTRTAIRAYVLGKSLNGCWGFQCLSEASSPPLSCPEDMLEAATSINPAWRSKVRQHHSQRRSVVDRV